MIIGKGNRTTRRLNVFLFGIAFFTVSVLLVSCGVKRDAGLKRHDLFTIPIGTLPDELDWFYRDGFRMAGAANIQSRDGLIYISGGEDGKIMVFNSYGDLLTYVYNPSKNPAPAEAEDGEPVCSIFGWPLRTPGIITPFDGGFLVDDGVDQNRRVIDKDQGIAYDRVILRFDKDGNYLGHLGREGLGGSPFPYISSLDVRKDGGIVVTCRTPASWISYWYDNNGRPVTTVMIREDQLPGLGEGGSVAVYAIRPDPVQWSLHIRLDVYLDEMNGAHPDPRLYTFNLSTLEYGAPIILPYVEGDQKQGIPDVPPEYLGTTVGGFHMLIAPESPEAYRMILVDSDGRLVQNRRLRIDSAMNVYRYFRLQDNGLITGIFFGSQEASVAWWRVDKIVGRK